jgi:PAS domain S-box-containing protein
MGLAIEGDHLLSDLPLNRDRAGSSRNAAMNFAGSGEGCTRPRLIGQTPLLVLLVCLFHGAPAAADATTGARLVVVLYPQNNDGSPGNALVNQNIRATFARGSAERIEIYDEYLDVAHPRNTEDQQFQVEYLRRKYARRKVDVVVAGLAPALDFALSHRDEIFPGVPIVFCTVDQSELKARTLPADVVGVPVRMDLPATLDLALKFHPDTQRVFVIAGKAKMDLFWAAEARRLFHPYEKNLEFHYLIGMTTEDLLTKAAHLPEQSIVYYLHVFQDGSGKALVPAFVLEQLANVATAPIYSHVDSYVGRGVVGGRVISFEKEGKNSAELALRILAGEKPETIGVQQASENTYLFDARQLQRWGISEEYLPAGSVVRHREPGFWALYKWQIISVIAVCVIQFLLLVGLLIQRASRARAKTALRESESRFRLMADTASVMVWMSGPDKRCTYVNKSWLDFTGQSLEHEVGDGWSEGVHADDLRDCLDTYVRAFDARQTFRMQYRLKRFDGTYRWILVSGVPRFNSGGALEGYIGSCIDVTEEKQTRDELLENQRELQALTRKLLQAQETERRRIARELHDDLNQSLALLSVEMDLLAQRPPESAAQLSGRMGDLSAQVRQLSSSVHDLSHQLHPSNLEQVGLVAAMRGLCKALAQAHGLEIQFNHYAIPELIPEDAALCLYRITQEALGNVIKHSGARHADVDLLGRADGIDLRVVDDGRGFDTASTSGHEGLGLVSMRERLRLVDGEITIDSFPAGGARIEVRVPLRSVCLTASELKVGD